MGTTHATKVIESIGRAAGFSSSSLVSLFWIQIGWPAPLLAEGIIIYVQENSIALGMVLRKF
jgi:hypothetical protein